MFKLVNLQSYTKYLLMKLIKHTLFKSGLLITLFLMAGNTRAQGTNLALGDIAFTGYNSEPAANYDEFCFVILKSTGITSGTTIYFTDRGWKNGSCGADNFCTTADNASFPESGSHFVWTSGSSLSYGTHVKIVGAGTSTTFTCSNGSASGTVLNLSTGGDQIFATQNGASGTNTTNGPSAPCSRPFMPTKPPQRAAPSPPPDGIPACLTFR